MTTVDRPGWADALDWVRRIHDPSFSDWDGHIAWLEADPRHAAAFDQALIAVEGATAHLGPASLPAMPQNAALNDNDRTASEHRRSRRPGRGWVAGLAGSALAAGVIAAIALPSFTGGHARPYRIETASGQTRAITLADGSRVTLNGGSRLLLDHADPRVATVESGEAFFAVVHDAAHPFTVLAGGARFQDVGTAFDIIRSPHATQVAVREGAVMYDPAGAAVRLDRGQAIAVEDGAPAAGSAIVRSVDAPSVGLWQHGRLSYRDAALPVIAADLSRSLGHPVMVDPRLAGRRFTGVLILDLDRSRMLRRIAAVMDVSIRQDGATLRILPPTR